MRWKESKSKKIRSSVQAVVIKNNKLLCVKKYSYNKLMYILPGGGQEHGETLSDAVIRECFEETGIKIEPKELLYVQECIGKNHEHAQWDNHVHVVAHLFSCKIIDESTFLKGTEIDPEQISVEWLPLEKLDNYAFYPRDMIQNLMKYSVFNENHQVYLGDMG
nr:NUDIX domain-containing protein [Metabacillus halosaccharovorans]